MTKQNSYSQVQGSGVDALLSTVPPADLTKTELEKWYDGAMAYLAEIEAEVGEALWHELAIENDYDFIRGGC